MLHWHRSGLYFSSGSLQTETAVGLTGFRNRLLDSPPPQQRRRQAHTDTEGSRFKCGEAEIKRDFVDAVVLDAHALHTKMFAVFEPLNKKKMSRDWSQVPGFIRIRDDGS